MPAGLFEMSVDGGGTLQTYCIDIHNPTQQQAQVPGDPLERHVAGRQQGRGQDPLDPAELLPAGERPGGARRQGRAPGGLTEQDAAAGTQVAIWRYSDDADVDAVDPQAEKLADYLEKSAQNVAEPKASLTLDPPAVSGQAGERLGPVTVHTNAGQRRR